MSKYPGRIVSNLAPAGYSVYFDGTGDWIQAPSNAAFSPGTGDFTIECWAYLTAVTGEGTLFYVSVTNGINLFLNISSNWGIARAGVAVDNNFGTPPALNVWNHLAVSRSGTTIRAFINGAQVFSGSNSSNYAQGAALIGSSNSFGTVTGFISNFRFIKGTALYTAAFTPPTQLFNITNTSLLTCNSPALVDQSTNNFTITANGNAAVSTLTPFTAYVPYDPSMGAATPGVWTVDEAMQAAATRQWNMYDPSFNLTTLLLHGNSPTNAPTWLTDVSTNNYTITPVADARAAGLTPFSTASFPTSGSGYFDGTGDYLQFTSNTNVQFGSGDFTVEAWVYLPSLANTFYAIAGQRTGDSVATVGWSMYINASKASFDIANGTSSFTATNNTTLAVNTWYHIAAVRSGSNLTVYVNGTAGTPVTVSGSVVVTGSLVYVGFVAGSAITPFNGYISNVRIVKGVVVYTGNFTTPTAPLTATQAAGTNISAITGTQTSLLTLQNSQSANNNAFLDSSSNNFLITRNGNTTQGSFSPFSQAPGYWSNYFNGSSYLSIPSTSNLAFGTGDFCVEFWMNRAGAAAVGLYSNSTGSSGGDTQFEIQLDVNSKIVLIGWNTIFMTSATAITLNSWNHVAVVRSGTSMAIFINGVRDATATSANNFSSTNGFIIGVQATGSGYYTGHISNLRAVKGASVYSPSSLNITVPTVPLGATSGGQTPPTGTQTSLLTCQSSRFVDNGGLVTPNAVNVNGTPSVQSFSPFYSTTAYTPQTIGGSGFFDGTGDYLTVPSSAAFDMGSGAYTIEFWVYMNTLTGSQTFVARANSGAVFATFDIGWYSSALRFYVSNNGSSNAVSLTSSLSPVANAWTHVAVTRSGSTYTVWVNGASGGTATDAGSAVANGNNVGIGAYGNGANPINGYMSNVRIIKGTAVYTTAFTPPTAPLTAITNTQLLLNFINAGIIDSTGDNIIETVADARISTAVSRFGGSSMFFDGTGDYLSIRRSNLLLPIANQDFTFECWVYPTATPGAQGAVLMGAGEYGIDDNWNVNINSSLQVSIYIWSANASYTNTTRTVTLNTWNHVAVSRSGTGSNNLRVFVNGIGQSFSVNNTLVGPTRNFSIGADENGDEAVYTGYIDELRFTLGVGRYITNFTPQTSQWQDQ